MKEQSPARQLAGFIAEYKPEVRALTRAVLAKMRKRLPGAVELVYDNYNALVIGFGPSERASEAIFSIVAYPRWVTLFFLKGARLPDPDALLEGSGSIVRRITLKNAATIDKPAVRALMARALEISPKAIDEKRRRRLVIKSISSKQRPRR